MAGDTNALAGLPTGTVTLLFTDIEGSTRLLQELGPGYADELERHNALVRAAVSEHRGVVVDTTGDGFFVAFAVAADALGAAVAAQLALVGDRVRVRMGIHTGSVALSGSTYVGIAVHEAARVAAAGHGGQVLVTDMTAGLARSDLPDGVELLDVGEHHLKDLARLLRLFQVGHADLASSFAPLRTTEVRKHNLPAALTSFVGRSEEVAEVAEAVAACRLLTITGAGGCGKSRLAVEAAAVAMKQLDDGAWLIELASIADEAMVVPAVAAALGLRTESGDLEQLVIDYLIAKELVVVLDNCEHLIDECAALVMRLVASCPTLHVLCTSREPLGVSGEVAWRVPSLPDADAAQLFLERARLARPGFVVHEHETESLTDICRQLDGIPLALELAASRVSVLSIEQIAAKLGDSFRLLTGARRTSIARQQTLQATVDWSHDLLSTADRGLFRRLSVFAGGFSLEAAETVCSGEPIGDGDVLAVLSDLVEKSLVHAEPGDRDSRYRMLETMRQYGAAKLRDAGESEQWRSRHLAWALDFAEEANEGIRGARESEWLARLDLEHDNLHAALRWSLSAADRVPALRFVCALFNYWACRAGPYEAIPWVTEALEGSEACPPELRAPMLSLAALGAVNLGDNDRARALADEAFGLFPDQRPVGLYFFPVMAFTTLGRLEEAAGRPDKALALYRDSVSEARTVSDVIVQAKSLGVLGKALHEQGELAACRASYEEALLLIRRSGASSHLPDAILPLARLERVEGNLELSRQLGTEALDVARSVGNRPGEIDALLTLSFTTALAGSLDEATAFAEAGVSAARSLGGREHILNVLRGAAYIHLHSMRAGAARALMEESLAIAREIGSHKWLAIGLHSCGQAALIDGDTAAAAVFLDEADQLCGGDATAPLIAHERATMARLGRRFAVAHDLYINALQTHVRAKQFSATARTLRSLGALASAAGDPLMAATLFGAADTTFSSAGRQVELLDVADYELLLSEAVAAGGEAGFTAAYDKGRSLSLDDAVALTVEQSFG